MIVIAPIFLLLTGVVGALLASPDIEMVRAAVVLSVLTLTSVFVFSVVSRSDPEGSTLFTVLLASFALKLIAVFFRFQIGLLADAFVYNQVGRELASVLAMGQWPEMEKYSGTAFIRLVTGLVYFVTGPTMYGASILWAWFGLIGMLFFYKAFSVAFPNGDRRLYMFLVLLYPSMLLWTSSLGKDALAVLSLGMAAYGAARTHRRVEFIGLWWLGIGCAGVLMIRPHLVPVIVVAVAASALLRPVRFGLLSPVIRIGGLALVFVVGVFVVDTAARYIGLESLTAESVSQFVEAHGALTVRGGSAYQTVNARSLAGFVLAIPTVLIRPFPWEANKAFALVSGLEGMCLMTLMFSRWRSLRAALTATVRDSFLMMVFVYVFLFIFFFSNIANFGIIARQRTQVLPFVLMMIAYLRPGTVGQARLPATRLQSP